MKKFEIKKIVTESVIGFLNKGIVDDIPYTDKQKIMEAVKKASKRNGLLSFVYRDDVKSGKTFVGINIDPTARGDWVLAKEEILYELPIKYSHKLHEFVQKLRKKLI
jgi:hypothetical protein